MFGSDKQAIASTPVLKGSRKSLKKLSIAAEQQRFMVRVYNWMGAGLAITGIVSLLTASSEMMMGFIFGNPIIFFVLVIAELGMVFWLAGFIQRMSVGKAKGIFIGYSILNGLTLSSIFLSYSPSLVAVTFFITAGTFGVMSLYGYSTNRNITSWGSFLFMGLFGIIIAYIVNNFMRSPLLDFIISSAGILVFVGLTAHDTQKIKMMNVLGNEGTDADTKEAISGALILYLDFINLFLMLLRMLRFLSIFGRG
jgi:FtsH-binding integral membrane protein